MRTITIEVPDGVSGHDLHLAADAIADVTERAVGVRCTVDIEFEPITAQERHILGTALDIALWADETFGVFAGDQYDALSGTNRRALAALMYRLRHDATPQAVPDPRDRTAPHGDPHRDPETPGVTRPQELAADAMAAKHGRSAVQPQPDGAVIVRGLLDDIEMESVCVERDGRERWRRR